MSQLINPLSEGLNQLLPGAKLEWQRLSFANNGTQDIDLQLLAIESTDVQLDAEQIGLFWQQLPYWAFAWAAGQGLARYLLAHPELVKGKRVLDFGCGSGVVGIAAAKAGAASVVCCDNDPLALIACEVNALHNGVNIEAIRNWDDLGGGFDCLLAADILYDLTSAGDLSRRCESIPYWLVAETEYQLPPWSALVKVDSEKVTTLPSLQDFDQDLDVSIYALNKQL